MHVSGHCVFIRFHPINCAFISRQSSEGMSDFDVMLQRKKEEQSKRRKRKDIDIINDNDDIIAQLLSDMRHAAEVSFEATLYNFGLMRLFGARRTEG